MVCLLLFELSHSPSIEHVPPPLSYSSLKLPLFLSLSVFLEPLLSAVVFFPPPVFSFPLFVVEESAAVVAGCLPVCAGVGDGTVEFSLAE